MTCRSFMPKCLGGHDWQVVYQNFVFAWKFCRKCTLAFKELKHGYGGPAAFYDSYEELLQSAGNAEKEDGNNKG